MNIHICFKHSVYIAFKKKNLTLAMTFTVKVAFQSGREAGLLVRALDSRLKSCESESRQEWWENVLLQNQLCLPTLYSVSVPLLCYRSGT